MTLVRRTAWLVAALLAAGWIAAVAVIALTPPRVPAGDAAGTGAVWRAAAWLAAAAVVAAAAAAVVLRRWHRALEGTLAHAAALQQGRLVEAPDPEPADLRTITASLNAVARRLNDVYAAQAEQVQVLQRQAQHDALTGLPLRRGFVARLQALLAAPGGPGVALIIVRVLDLDVLNQRIGHDAADRLLAATAGLLGTYVEGVGGTFAGRLNGSDFALCLPVAGLGGETAASLHAALVAAPALHAGAAQIVVGAVDGVHAGGAGAALALADEALARAEAEGGLAVATPAGSVADLAGAGAWREQIGSALAEGRARLDEVDVRDRSGALVHRHCTLRVQLTPGGDYHAAARWLALARRSKLLPQVDLATIDLALAAIAADGVPRVVQIALPSLVDTGFATEVAARVCETPRTAANLRIEWASQTFAPDRATLAATSERWRNCGVRLGLQHGGAPAQQLLQWPEVGVEHVTLDARHLRGVAADAALHAYVKSLVTLVRAVGPAIFAHDVDQAADLDALWALGIDGASGAAVAAAAG